MNSWKSFEINPEVANLFAQKLNAAIAAYHDKVYWKIFTLKDRVRKHKIYYIADEGSNVVEKLEKSFTLNTCSPPPRETLVRVGGFTKDRDWMFQVQE